MPEYDKDLNEVPAPKVVKWASGGVPIMCDICHQDVQKVGKFFVDGRHRQGPWGLFCSSCWILDGCGKLGTGYGQKYDSKTLLKVEG